jgi:CRP-like cAMP-binding protein
MELVELGLRQDLEHAGKPIAWAYFIESGLASVVAGNDELGKIEVGMVGPEGMTGIGLLLEDEQATFDVFVQGPGEALRISADRLREAMSTDAEIRRLLVRFAHAFGIQVATTALANGQAKLESRLARWLLMVSDRLGASFHVTHEFLALMLAVRRSGVTLGLHILEGKALIRATRGAISIIDRDGLIAHAAGSYGFAEAEYRRLLG